MDSGDKPRRSRELSDKETELWARIADSATPLNKDKIVKRPEGKIAKSVQNQQTNPGVNRPVSQKTQTRAKKDVTKKPPPLANFDHKKARKIARGQDDIDARIDLHGLRQGPAHNALRSFLINAQAKNHRNVLVITGKGSSRNAREETSWYDAEEPGVLRRMFPVWLAEPDLRPIVVSFTEAHARHGGSGAYYVRIRKLGK